MSTSVPTDPASHSISSAFSIISTLIDKLGPLAIKIWYLREDLEKLKNLMAEIQAVILDAEETQRISYSHELNHWLKNLNDALHEAEDLIDEVSTKDLSRQVMTKHKNFKKFRIFFSSSNQIGFYLIMAFKLRDMMKMFHDLNVGKRVFNFLRHTPNQQVINQRNTNPFVFEQHVIGREVKKNMLISWLLNFKGELEPTISVIAIVGIGWLGKTTLAKLAFADPIVQEHFQFKKWVSVADNFSGFDANSIAGKIAWCNNNDDMEPVLEKLKQKTEGLRCLIVLDDVWSESRQGWDQLMEMARSMKVAKGSKLIVTTRSETVATVSRASSILHLDGLDEEQSWSLFSRHVFGAVGKEPENKKLVTIGKDIVKKCAGVPLAIRVIGDLMASMDREQDWLNVNNKDLAKIDEQDENRIFQFIKLSYEQLPFPLKRCFAFCSLFPKDAHINKNLLIRLWIANEFILSSDANTSLEDVAEKYFLTLLHRSFFQDIKRDENGYIYKFKMHAIMHDLACSIANYEYVKMDKRGQPHVDKQTCHISFCLELGSSCTLPSNPFHAEKLRTFLSHQSSWLQEPACKSIMSRFKQLRVLTLNFLSIRSIPSCIGALKHLRSLDISGSKLIEVLPRSITKLYNLETLLLIGCCWLRELPKDIWKLTRLRHLVLIGCVKLSFMPLGIGQLTSLQTLLPFVLSEQGAGARELGELNNLTKRLTIFGLKCLRPAPRQVKRMNLMRKSHIEVLELFWSLKEGGDTDFNGKDDIMLQCMRLHPNTKKLSINGFGGVQISSSVNLFSHLNKLQLVGCPKLQYLPISVFNVKSLRLQNLPSLEWLVNDNNSANPSPFSSSLEQIKLQSLPNLKGWCGCSEESLAGGCHQFKGLDNLWISDCPNVISIPQHTNQECTALQCRTVSVTGSPQSFRSGDSLDISDQ